jgi:hypothetical protein
MPFSAEIVGGLRRHFEATFLRLTKTCAKHLNKATGEARNCQSQREPPKMAKSRIGQPSQVGYLQPTRLPVPFWQPVKSPVL